MLIALHTLIGLWISSVDLFYVYVSPADQGAAPLTTPGGSQSTTTNVRTQDDGFAHVVRSLASTVH